MSRELIDSNARNWAAACHLAGLLAVAGAPFGNLIGPLVLFLLKKDEHPFIARAGRESLNFQIFVTLCATILFAAFVATVIDAIARNAPPWGAVVILPALVALALLDVISVLIAAVRTSNGEDYSYSISLRFVR